MSAADADAALRLRPIDVGAMAAQDQLSELDLAALVTNDSTYVRAPKGVTYYRKPFEFLSLGIMAYVGAPMCFFSGLGVGLRCLLLWRHRLLLALPSITMRANV